MAPDGLEVGRPALVCLEPWWRGPAVLVCTLGLIAAGLHARRDARWGPAAGLALVAVSVPALGWMRRGRDELAALRWREAGWHAQLGGKPEAIPVYLTGLLATDRGMLLRVRSVAADRAARRDELFWVDGQRVGDPRWTVLRSTLRLALPPEPPSAPAP